MLTIIITSILKIRTKRSSPLGEPYLVYELLGRGTGEDVYTLLPTGTAFRERTREILPVYVDVARLPCGFTRNDAVPDFRLIFEGSVGFEARAAVETYTDTAFPDDPADFVELLLAEGVEPSSTSLLLEGKEYDRIQLG